jgi:3-hydroxybutyryl-CoA dehydrogenase
MAGPVVAVLGAGTIGRGVAQNLAQTGHRVLLIDVSETALAAARREIRTGIRLGGLFGREGGNTAEVLARIEATTGDECLAGADIVIENVPEQWAIKEALYRRMDQICAPHCIVAANTSAIPITRLASCTDRPDRVIGTQ